MTRAESYIQEYTNLNRAYNQIFDSLQILIEAEDSDPEICGGINSALTFLDEILDAVKEERDAALNKKSKDEDDHGIPPRSAFKVF